LELQKNAAIAPQLSQTFLKRQHKVAGEIELNLRPFKDTAYLC
jgi:hypothetical protein